MIMSDKRTSDNRIAFYVAAGKILAMIAQFVMPLFLTRFLTKHDYGLYSQFYLIFGFLLSVFGMGIQANLYYFYPKVVRLKNLSWYGEMFCYWCLWDFWDAECF